MKRLKFLIAVLSIFPFVVEANQNFSPDISLIRIWDKEFYQNHSYQPFPKIVRFELTNQKKSLTFVATKHKDWQKSHKQIEIAIEQTRPDIILIEGIGKSDGMSPRIWDGEIKQNLNVEGFEAYYAYKLAVEKNIPFVGAELEGKMSDHTSYERDVAVLTSIAELLNQYAHVMVVYGAGHFVQQEKALEKMLGSAIRINRLHPNK